MPRLVSLRPRRPWLATTALLSAFSAITLALPLAFAASVPPPPHLPQLATPLLRTYVPMVALGSGTAPLIAGLPWSDPATWGGRVPEAGEQVTIPADKTVVLDISPPPLAGLQIDGTLLFAEQDVQLSASWIMLHGRLAIGSALQPFTHKAEITLTANDTTENLMGMGTRGILLMGGKLELYGTAPRPAWTKLADHAAANTTSLSLLGTVDWQSGDQLVVAPTDFYRVGATERLTMSAVLSSSMPLTGTSAASSTVMLQAALQNARWGKLQYVTRSGMSLTPDPMLVPPTPGTPTILDERAEVGNLSRNIVIQGADDALWRSAGFGAQVMAMAGSTVQLDGVELRRVGQSGRSGRYPIHFHLQSYDADGRLLADATSSVRNSTIWNSQNRCIVLHGTNGVRVQQNICYDVRGHAIFLEDAVERRNLLEGNLVLRVRNPEKSKQLQVHDGDIFQGGSSGFWLTNPDNTVRGNAAADTEGNGFWLSFPEQTLGLSKKVALRPTNTPFGIFEDNVAHSNNSLGLNLDWVPINDTGEVTPLKYIPMQNGTGDVNDWSKRLRFAMTRSTTYKNEGGGYWNRASWPDYAQWVSADNPGTFFAGAGDDGLITSTLIVGASLNNRTPAPADRPPVAVASYHSTFDIAKNLLVNFPFVEGQSSGTFKTDDYYIRGVDKGLIRNPGNMLVASHPGFRTPPTLTENWTLAGALWDPHGYWGPQGNYWVYDQPFLTSGANCQQVLPAGKNGASCEGPYYGVDGFQLDRNNESYSALMPISVTRVAATGEPLGLWTVGDGKVAPKLGNMRHFSAHKDGRYVLRFPSSALPREVALIIDNAYRADDSFLLAVDYSGAATPQAYITTVYNYDDAENWQPGDYSLRYKRALSATTSLEQVAASAGDRFWQDQANNLVWVKVVGGLPSPGQGEWKPNSDEVLYQPMRLRIFPQR